MRDGRDWKQDELGVAPNRVVVRGCRLIVVEDSSEQFPNGAVGAGRDMFEIGQVSLAYGTEARKSRFWRAAEGGSHTGMENAYEKSGPGIFYYNTMSTSLHDVKIIL